MNLWSQYLKERLGKSVLDHEKGFAVYFDTTWCGRKAVYIEEIYTVPEARRQNVASGLADEIVKEAKARGCELVLGSVCPEALGSTRSLKVLLGYGFTLATIQNNLIMFSKEI